MEDRKRALIADVDDLAPSRKRLKDENGSTMRMDEQKERDVEVRIPLSSARCSITRTDYNFSRTTKRTPFSVR
jgi:hypothetical protein